MLQCLFKETSYPLRVEEFGKLIGTYQIYTLQNFPFEIACIINFVCKMMNKMNWTNPFQHVWSRDV